MNRNGRPGSKRSADGRFAPEMYLLEREADQYRRSLERNIRALERASRTLSCQHQRINRHLPKYERRIADARATIEQEQRPVPLHRPPRERA
jgi:septal ring factor EnvC (AmiA/AmiB activator)